MTPQQARALTSIALFAAFADGVKSDAERASIKDVVEGLGDTGMTESLRRVLMKETTPHAEAAMLDSDELRTLAWETALAVCESDGTVKPAERAFLDAIAASLGRSAASVQANVEEADAITLGATAPGIVAPLPVLNTAGPAATVPASTNDPRSAEVDESITKYAILTASIELLPQGLASLAIIPLQTKMVHGIGKTYGHSLSADSIKELAATVGIGMTGQAVEKFARRILGGLAGGIFGGVGRGVGSLSAGAGMTFATTYAMGQVAKQYYAGGRQLSAIDLKSVFSRQVEQAKTMYEKYEPQIRRTATTVDPRQLLQSLRA